ncbi:MAG: taurine ABC transporter substrate-binding protein, partial [Pseudomonadota bacterium]
MTRTSKLLAAAAGLAILATAPGARAADEITVAYFLEWPMPFQYGKVQGIYEDELGVDINWVAFDTG